MEPVTAIYIGTRTTFQGPDKLWYTLHEDADGNVTYCDQIGGFIELYLSMYGLGK